MDKTTFRFIIVRREYIDYDAGGNKFAEWEWDLIDHETGDTEEYANLNDVLDTIRDRCLE